MALLEALTFILMVLPYADSRSNAGKTFYQTFNWNQPTVEGNVTHSFILSTDALNCTVTITVDHPPLKIYTQDISQGNAVVYKLNVTSTRGIKLDAPCDFVVYGLNFANESADGWMGIPLEALGTEYAVLAVQPFLASEPTQLTIVATADNTTCTSYLTNGTQKVSKLNETQVAYMEGKNLDFTGTKVVCNNKVSVLAGQRCSFIPAGCGWCDHTVEQIPPKNTLGRNFILVPLQHSCAAKPSCCTDATFCAKCTEIYRIMAIENNTQVTRYGTETNGSFVLQADQSQYMLLSQTEISRLISSKPVMIAHYFGGQVYQGKNQDPSFAIVSQMESYAQKYQAATCFPQFKNHFFNFVTPANSSSQLLLNGAPFLNGSTAVAIPGTKYEAYRYQVNCTIVNGLPAVTPFVVEHAQNASFGLFAYGFSQFISYGYPGGMNLNEDLYFKCAPPQINVTNSTIQFQSCNLTSPPLFPQPITFSDDQCCQGNASVSYVDKVNTTTCQVTINRTWTLTDGCARTVQIWQIAKISKPLDIYQAPMNTLFNGQCASCNSTNTNVTGRPILVQGCNTTTSITFTDKTDKSTYVNRTWVVVQQCTTDKLVFNQSIFCGNKYANCTQPQINVSSMIYSQACSLSSAIPMFSTPSTFTDDRCCPSNGNLTYSDKVLNTTACQKTIQRTWTLRDGCARSVQASQIAIIQQMIDVYQFPQNSSFDGDCAFVDPSVSGAPTLVQDCSTTLTVGFSDSTDQETYVDRTWTIAQECTSEKLVYNQSITCGENDTNVDTQHGTDSENGAGEHGNGTKPYGNGTHGNQGGGGSSGYEDSWEDDCNCNCNCNSDYSDSGTSDESHVHSGSAEDHNYHSGMDDTHSHSENEERDHGNGREPCGDHENAEQDSNQGEEDSHNNGPGNQSGDEGTTKAQNQ